MQVAGFVTGLVLFVGLLALLVTMQPKCQPGEVLIYPRYGAAVCIAGHR